MKLIPYPKSRSIYDPIPESNVDELIIELEEKLKNLGDKVDFIEKDTIINEKIKDRILYNLENEIKELLYLIYCVKNINET